MANDLNSMSIQELVALYNTKAPKPIKNFRDKATAIARCQELGLSGGSGSGSTKPKKAKDEAKGKPGRKREIMDLPYVGSEHSIREGSLRHRFMEQLKDGGATLAQLVKTLEKHDGERQVESDPEQAEMRVRNTLRVMHSYNGYGIREKDGRFFIVTK